MGPLRGTAGAVVGNALVHEADTDFRLVHAGEGDILAGAGTDGSVLVVPGGCRRYTTDGRPGSPEAVALRTVAVEAVALRMAAVEAGTENAVLVRVAAVVVPRSLLAVGCSTASDPHRKRGMARAHRKGAAAGDTVALLEAVGTGPETGKAAGRVAHTLLRCRHRRNNPGWP